jgi:hypothetical protein
MRLFINYAGSDSEQIEQLGRLLHQYETNLDTQLMPGSDWAAELSAAITQADAFIYALSPDSLASEWCQWSLAQAISAGKPVIPVTLRESASIPDLLESLDEVDLRLGVTAESIAPLIQALEQPTAYTVMSTQAVAAPEKPSGIPPQAFGTLSVSRADAPSRVLLPNVLHVLPPPFEWLEIPEGDVTLYDASEQGGSKGGTFRLPRFFIAKYPVTNAQFRVFAEDNKGYESERWWNFSAEATEWRGANTVPVAGASEDENAPRVLVNWYEAVAFCRWLNVRVRPSLAMREAAGRRQPDPEHLPTVTLPTEQQWQRAAEADNDQMDLSGSILEWCMTNWGADEVILGGAGERILRVGSLDDQFIDRITHRDYAGPDARDERVGFRLVCVLPE